MTTNDNFKNILKNRIEQHTNNLLYLKAELKKCDKLLEIEKITKNINRTIERLNECKFLLNS